MPCHAVWWNHPVRATTIQRIGEANWMGINYSMKKVSTGIQLQQLWKECCKVLELVIGYYLDSLTWPQISIHLTIQGSIYAPQSRELGLCRWFSCVLTRIRIAQIWGIWWQWLCLWRCKHRCSSLRSLRKYCPSTLKTKNKNSIRKRCKEKQTNFSK